MAKLYLLIAFGGALGSVFRFWLAGALGRQFGEAFPWGTLAVNVIGSFVIGFISSLASLEGRPEMPLSARHFLMTGVLGGFTTFSSFSLQTLMLAKNGEWGRAGGYVVASVMVCLFAVWLGYVSALALRTRS